MLNYNINIFCSITFNISVAKCKCYFFFQLQSEKNSEILSHVSGSVVAGTYLFHSFHHTNEYKQLSVYSCALIMASNPGWWANSERTVLEWQTQTL